MTDKEKLKQLLESFGIPFIEYDESIGIDNWTEDTNEKVTGVEWASCAFNFDKNGKFETIDLQGD